MSYPSDYGFVEGTLAEDGDPLDALVLVSDPTFPGCRIRVRPIGIFHMSDEKGPDEKIICVPLNDPIWGRLSDIHDIPSELRDEIEHFFQVYKDLDQKGSVVTRGFGNRAEAEEASPSRARRAAAPPSAETKLVARCGIPARGGPCPDAVATAYLPPCTEYGARVSRSRF